MSNIIGLNTKLFGLEKNIKQSEPTRAANDLGQLSDPAGKERVLNPIVSESYMKKYIEEHGGITPTGNIEITENGENINVAPYATATVNVAGGGGATWTTVAEEQTGTTVYNSGAELYFLQLSNVTDFGSPVIKVTLDDTTYYCYWDNQAGAWHDAYYTVVVAATVYMGTAYWGIAKVSDTSATTHTGKIERIADYSLAYCTTTQKGYFINNDTGKTIMTSETIGTASYGCEKITSGSYTLLKVNGGYATFTQGSM